MARLELIQDPTLIASTIVGADKPVSSVSTEMQELLWTLMEKSGEALDSRQQNQLYQQGRIQDFLKGGSEHRGGSLKKGGLGGCAPQKL